MNLTRALRLPETRTSSAVEVRNPRAATVNLSYRSPGAPMVAEWDAEEAFRFGYLSNIVVYRCVQIIAETIAALPFRAGRSMTDPQNFNEGAPLAKLLGPPPYGPNPEMAADDIWANAISQYLVAGRFGWEIEYAGKIGGSQVMGLWPLAAHRLGTIPTSGHTSREYFAGFTYGPRGEEIKLSTDQVFYMWRPSLHDYRQPESALQAARYDIAVAVMQDRYDNAFLRNDARPASVMIVQRFAERSQYAAFKEQINSEYGGPDNAGKTMILESEGDEDGNVSGAMTVQTLGISQKDAEFIKRHELKFRNIAIALGVPWSKLDSSGRTWDNADKEDETWEESTIIPLCRKLQNHVNMKLAPKVGSEVGWFDLTTLKSSKPVSHFQQVPLTEAYRVGIITHEESRAEVGLEPAEPGDEFYQEPPAQIAVPEQPILDLPSEEVEVERTVPVVETRAEEPDDNLRKVKIYNEHTQRVDAQERTWRRSFSKQFARQEAEVIKRLEGKRARQVLRGEGRALWDETFDPEYWRAATEAEVVNLYEMTYTVGGQPIAARFDIAFDIEAPGVQQQIATRSSLLAQSVTKTTHEAIRKELGEGVAKGEGIPELSARVRSVFDSASKARSEMIARTEVSAAFNSAALEVVRDLPPDVVAGKEWIGSGDNDECVEYAARGPVSMGDSWDGLDAPPSHPNCRCTVAFLTPAEMGDLAPRRKMVELRVARRLILELGKAA